MEFEDFVAFNKVALVRKYKQKFKVGAPDDDDPSFNDFLLDEFARKEAER